MRVRELEFHNFRSFRGRHQISFVDPLTNDVRPVTVIAGTNGSGKTTILNTIQELLSLLQTVGTSTPPEAELQDGLVYLELELDASEEATFFPGPATQAITQTNRVCIARGQRALAPEHLAKNWPVGTSAFVDHASPKALTLQVERMERGEIPLQGGLIYFPDDRRIGHTNGGPIEQPLQQTEWIARYGEADRWQGSLEQLWVWENYLDLEQGSQEKAHLKPFVSTVENLLGPGRTITIREGRVRVPTPWSTNGGGPTLVRLDQLPSGEQQILLLFGELARRRRPGAILLIDEPEASLHPTLQRRVVHQLRTVARNWNMQLIMATHSLEILRAVHETERIILDQLDATPVRAMP
jgi:energy-coupling factor transporter ATP-binding protein EcfA2